MLHVKDIMKAYRKGAKVQWKWAGGLVSGTVSEIFKKSVTKTLKDKKITRHGSAEKPAYLVKSVAGNFALKLHTELIDAKASGKVRTKKLTPRFDTTKLE